MTFLRRIWCRLFHVGYRLVVMKTTDFPGIYARHVLCLRCGRIQPIPDHKGK